MMLLALLFAAFCLVGLLMLGTACLLRWMTLNWPMWAVLLAGITPLTLWYVDPRMLSVRWSQPEGLPFEITREVQLASSWRVIKHSALKLACASNGRSYLLLQARVPGPREYITLGSPGITLFLGKGIRRQTEFRADLVALGRVDTLVTTPLTPPQLRALADGLDVGRLQKVSVGIGSESMVFMSSDVMGASVRRLVRQCGSGYEQSVQPAPVR